MHHESLTFLSKELKRVQLRRPRIDEEGYAIMGYFKRRGWINTV